MYPYTYSYRILCDKLMYNPSDPDTFVTGGYNIMKRE